MTTPAEFQALKDEVTQTVGTMQSAAVLIGGIRQRIQDAIDAFAAEHPGVDVSEFVAVTTELDAGQTALAEAVAANS